jgi:hypothetical protein
LKERAVESKNASIGNAKCLIFSSLMILAMVTKSQMKEKHIPVICPLDVGFEEPF